MWPTVNMPAGNTLLQGQVPSTRGCTLEVPIETDSASSRFWNTMKHLCFGLAVTCCVFDLWAPIEKTARFDGVSSRIQRAPAVFCIVIVVYALLGQMGGFRTRLFVIAVIAIVLGLLALIPESALLAVACVAVAAFALLFAVHYCFLRTAFPCERDCAEKYRRSIIIKVPAVLITLPLILPYALGCLVSCASQAWYSLVSWITYNRHGLNTGGIFRSPAGPRALRVACFHSTIAISARAQVYAVDLWGSEFGPLFEPSLGLVALLFFLVYALPLMVTVGTAWLTVGPLLPRLAKIEQE